MAGILTYLQGRPTPHRGRVARRLRRWDARLEEAVDRRRSPGADRLFYSLSSAADHGLLWLTLGAARAALRGRPASEVLRLGGVLGAESVLTNGVVKTAFRRMRPEDRHRGAPLPYGLHRPITSSFPSGHAASAFAAASLLAEDDPLAPAYYALATLVAASRVYVRLHHGADVVAGGAWGLLLGQLARRRFPLSGA